MQKKYLPSQFIIYEIKIRILYNRAKTILPKKGLINKINIRLRLYEYNNDTNSESHTNIKGSAKNYFYIFFYNKTT